MSAALSATEAAPAKQHDKRSAQAAVCLHMRRRPPPDTRKNRREADTYKDTMTTGLAIRALLLLAASLPAASAFAISPLVLRPASGGRLPAAALSTVSMGKRPIHTSGEFTVEKATPEMMEDLEVKRWPTWSTAGSEKYKVGIKSPLKVYDVNELSYIISGKMEIESKETGEKKLVQV